jgi:protein-S-isoprenylcysteine O-methyltransferase Ste14
MGLFSTDDRRDTAIAWGFVLVQLALLVAIVMLPTGDDWTVPGWLDAAGSALQLAGAGALVAGIANLGRSLTPLPTPVDHGVLQVRGLYRWVRHPIYAGIDALVVGTAIRSASLPVAVAAGALVAWFALKARWEEQHLRRRYPGYDAYAARTPRFVPFWPVRGRVPTAGGAP